MGGAAKVGAAMVASAVVKISTATRVVRTMVFILTPPYEFFAGRLQLAGKG